MIKNMLVNALLALATATALTLSAVSSAADTPRVGLVLAGGGARGLAHIGVIKYLEEHGIRVHAIAGTSMGAIVGGMYASGLDASAMEEIATTLDWKYALDDTTPRDQLSFRRKQEDLDFLVRAKMRFKDGKLRLPMGAIEGQHLNLLLHDIVGHVSRVRDFDALPIPFRAVATDIATGAPVILRDGDLAVAMRASMSIPGIFSPVDIGGKLLVDGGIANNVPVDVVQAMGVDRLIVIDVGTPLYDREKLENVLSLMDQLTTIMTRKNSEQQLARMDPDDILVAPALDEAGVLTMGFDKAELAIRLGYEAAATMAPQLAALAAGPGALRVAERPRVRLPRIDEIRVESNAVVSKALLRNMIKQPIGERLDREQMERDIAEIYGLDEFSRVDYDVAKEGERYLLTLRATAHPAGISYLKLGMSWDQDSRGSSEFGLRASWRQKGINRLGAEWYTVGQLGGRSRFGSEFYQPLDVGRRFFVDARYEYQQRLINISDNGEVRARAVVDDHRIELAPGMHIANLASLRAGVFAGTADTDIQIGSPLLSSQSEDDGGSFTELRYDSLDRSYFPRRGMRLVSRYDNGLESWGAEDYEAWSTTGVLSRSWGRHTVNATARWSQLDLDGDETVLTLPSQVFTLGGFLSLSGYTRDALAGNYLGLANLVYYRRLNEQSILPTDLPVYAGASIEAGNTWFYKHDVAWDDLLFAGSLFLGVDSPLGPVYLGVGLGENDQRALYLQVGQVFD
ncbi:MAG: patatin-like phospholipase family protein [Pseudomonadales bacterium]|nr:patatin-like phospholipase family protein [Pseudomonadales bacterium]MBP9032439.1 patatin-like phospholipase family protein [Pseudomonadales bacterium]